MGFSKQEHWSGLPFPPLGDLPDPGITPVFPALAGDSLLLSHQGSAALSPLRRKFSTANLSMKSNLFGFHMVPELFKFLIEGQARKTRGSQSQWCLHPRVLQDHSQQQRSS